MTTPQMRPRPPGQRQRFANQLRGIAALMVLVSHLVGVFWIVPDVVTAVTYSPAQSGPPPGILPLVAYPWVNFGPLGVALFFLISGLVIPFSLDRHSRTTFALARLLRIYPTYLAALSIELLILYAASHAWGRPFTLSAHVILSNALLIYDLVGDPSIDLVNWTLSVELKFYLLAIVMLPALRAGRASIVVLAGAAILGLNAAIRWGWVGDIAAAPSSPSYTASSHSLCLAYMLIGVLFNFHARGLVSTARLCLTVAAMGLMFVMTWRTSVWATQYPVVTLNYLYAFILFAGLYAGRHLVPPNPVLDGMAAISFPLYVLHSLVGYSMLRALMVGGGLGYSSAMAVTLPMLLVIATILHRCVERPTARAGQGLAHGPVQSAATG